MPVVNISGSINTNSRIGTYSSFDCSISTITTDTTLITCDITAVYSTTLRGKISNVIIDTYTLTSGLLKAKGILSETCDTSTSTSGILKGKTRITVSVNTNTNTVSNISKFTKVYISGVSNPRSNVGTLTTIDFSRTVVKWSSTDYTFDSVSVYRTTLRGRGRLLTNIDTYSSLSGIIASDSVLKVIINNSSSVLTTLKANGKLIGSVDDSSTVSVVGHLHYYATVSIITSSSVVGVIQAKGKLSGTISSTTSTNTIITGKGGLTGVIITESITSASYTFKQTLFAVTTVNCSSTTDVILTSKSRINSSTDSSSSILGVLRGVGYITCTVDTISDISGDCKNQLPRMLVNTYSFVEANLLAKGVLQGTVDGSSSIGSSVGTSIYTRSLVITKSFVSGSLSGVTSNKVIINTNSSITGVLKGYARTSVQVETGTSCMAIMYGTGHVVGESNGYSGLLAELDLVDYGRIFVEIGTESDVYAVLSGKTAPQIVINSRSHAFGIVNPEYSRRVFLIS